MQSSQSWRREMISWSLNLLWPRQHKLRESMTRSRVQWSTRLDLRASRDPRQMLQRCTGLGKQKGSREKSDSWSERESMKHALATSIPSASSTRTVPFVMDSCKKAKMLNTSRLFLCDKQGWRLVSQVIPFVVFVATCTPTQRPVQPVKPGFEYVNMPQVNCTSSSLQTSVVTTSLSVNCLIDHRIP